jgi:hypothetical protein
MTTDLIPEALREAVENDLRPVRPLHPAWSRTLVVATVVALVLATALLVLKLQLRPDLREMPMWLSWGCSILELIGGVFLVGLALREAVPGAGVPTTVARAAVGAGVALQILVGIATWVRSPGMAMGDDWISMSIVCVRRDATMVLPIFVVTMWLVFRALPLKAPLAGILGGGGAAITGDAITHLLCPMSDLRHVLVWHTGAILGFMLLGWIAGLLWQRYRWR